MVLLLQVCPINFLATFNVMTTSFNDFIGLMSERPLAAILNILVRKQNNE